jgi:hypothetical protein
VGQVCAGQACAGQVCVGQPCSEKDFLAQKKYDLEL